VRPFVIDHRFAQFALAIDHRSLILLLPLGGG
jgi:hypothetical protein